jgi:flagellar biosynthesis/type III secretory pathway chaperone
MEKDSMLGSDIGQEERLKEDIDFDGLLDALLSVLREEVEVYKELRSIIAEEFDILMRPTIDLLSYSNAKKETCVLKVRMLEEVRSNIIKKIARLIDREDKEIDFATLYSYADESRTAELDAQRKILSPLIQSINEKNEKNKDLLDYSLSYIRGSMDFINNLLSTGAEYAPTGKLTANNVNGRILNRKG